MHTISSHRVVIQYAHRQTVAVIVLSYSVLTARTQWCRHVKKLPHDTKLQARVGLNHTVWNALTVSCPNSTGSFKVSKNQLQRASI